MNGISEDLSDFSRNLYKLRKESGFTLETLANLIGISKSTICRYEHGRQEPTKYNRALLASVFGVPGYSLFEDEKLPRAYLPDVAIKIQEEIRYAMLACDYDRIDELVYDLHLSLRKDDRNTSLLQLKAYTQCWSYFHQGAFRDRMTDRLLACLRISRPDFSIDTLFKVKKPLTYTELSICNAIGTELLRNELYRDAIRLFAVLLKETDSVTISTERRFFHKCAFSINMSMAIRHFGHPVAALRVLKRCCRNAFYFGSPAICIRLELEMVKILKALGLESAASDRADKTRYMYQVFSEDFFFGKSFSMIEKESNEGVMVL